MRRTFLKNTNIVASILTTTLLVCATPSAIEAASLKDDLFKHLLSEGTKFSAESTARNSFLTPSLNLKNFKSQYAVKPDKLLNTQNNVVLGKGPVKTKTSVSVSALASNPKNAYADIQDENLLIALNDVVLGKGEVTTPILISELENNANTSIDLSGRGISDISGIEHLSGVSELNLSYNSISDLNPLYDLKKLTSLDLSHNYVNNLDGVGALIFWAQECGGGRPGPGCTDTYLKTLDLSYNYLTDAEDGLSVMNINSYDLSGNFLPTEQFEGQNYFTLPSRVDMEIGEVYSIPIEFTSLATPEAEIYDFVLETDVRSPNGKIEVDYLGFDELMITAVDIGVEYLEVELIPGLTYVIEVHISGEPPVEVEPDLDDTPGDVPGGTPGGTPSGTSAEYNVSIGFTPGSLNLTSNIMGPIDLGTVYLGQGTLEASAGIGEFIIDDYTGLGEGWKLSVSADRLATDSLELPANSLFIDPNGLTHDSSSGQGEITLASEPLYIDNGSSHIIAQATPNNGLGTHILDLTGNILRLEVDSSNAANGRVIEEQNGNQYKTTITFTLTQGI